MLRVLLGDPEAEYIAIKPLRRLLVGDPQIHVADACQLDHRGVPGCAWIKLLRLGGRKHVRKALRGFGGPTLARIADIAQSRAAFAPFRGIVRLTPPRSGSRLRLRRAGKE